MGHQPSHINRFFAFPLLLAAAALPACATGPGEERRAEPAPTPTPALSERSIAQQIVDANRAQETALHLVTRLYLDGDNQLAEFYAPPGGGVIFMMAGRPTSHVALRPEALAGKSLDEVYALLAPGRAVPDELAALSARVGQLGPPQGAGARTAPPSGVSMPEGPARLAPAAPPTPSPEGESVGQAQQALTNGYCGTGWLNDFSCPPPPNPWAGGSQWCDTDWWGNNGPWWVHGGNVSYYNVCPEVSSVYMFISGSDGQEGWTVLQDTYRWFHRYGGSNCGFLSCCECKYDESMWIQQADSSEYNTAGYFVY
jgi:hypothetical protein